MRMLHEQIDRNSDKKSVKAELENIYRQTWEMLLNRNEIDRSLSGYHYPALAEWITRVYRTRSANKPASFELR